MAMEVLTAEVLSPSEDGGGYQDGGAEGIGQRCFTDAFTSRKPASYVFKKKWLWRYRFGIHSRLELWQVPQNGVLRSMFYLLSKA